LQRVSDREFDLSTGKQRYSKYRTLVFYHSLVIFLFVFCAVGQKSHWRNCSRRRCLLRQKLVEGKFSVFTCI